MFNLMMLSDNIPTMSLGDLCMGIVIKLLDIFLACSKSSIARRVNKSPER